MLNFYGILVDIRENTTCTDLKSKLVAISPSLNGNGLEVTIRDFLGNTTAVLYLKQGDSTLVATKTHVSLWDPKKVYFVSAKIMTHEKEEAEHKKTEEALSEALKSLKELQEKVNKIENFKRLCADGVAGDQLCPVCGQASNEKKKREEVEKLVKTSGEEFTKPHTKHQSKDIHEQSVEDLYKREREHSQMVKEFETKCNEWKKAMEESIASSKQSGELISEIKGANDQVLRDKAELVEKMVQAEEIKERLEVSETSLSEKVERMQQYITIIRQQRMLPEAVAYKNLLESVKHLRLPPVKCFISYAWWPDNDKNVVLEAQLLKLKDDLTKVGLEVILDWTNMEGDMDYYTHNNGNQTNYRVLLICTPRRKGKAEDKKQNNNLQKEFNEALAKQKVDPKFIVPLILEGDRDSIPLNLPNVLSINFAKPENYCNLMTSLTPFMKGLIPMLLGLENNFLYEQLLKGYLAQVALMQNKRRKTIG